MRILLATRNPGPLPQYLRSRGMIVNIVANAEEAREDLRTLGTNALVLDMTLPGSGGVEFIKRLSEHRLPPPVVAMCPGTNGPLGSISVLLAGAHDAVIYPARGEEIAARVAAAVRRSFGHTAGYIASGNLKLDMVRGYCFVDGHKVRLSGQAFILLELLMLNRDTIVSGSEVDSYVFDPMLANRNLRNVVMCRLRRTLDKFGATVVIENRCSRGFMLRAARPGERASSANIYSGNMPLPHSLATGPETVKYRQSSSGS